MAKRYPVIALLALIGLAFSWLAISAWQGRGHDGATWSRTYRSHAFIVPFGPHAWISPYNEGTGYLMQERYADGLAPLKKALRSVGQAKPNAAGSIGGSDECRVRMNLSLALEGEARRLDPSEKDLARTLMTEAADTSRPCTTDGAGGEGSTSPEDLINQRQRAAGALEKNQNDDDKPSDDPTPQGEGGEPDPTPSPDPTLDSKQDQLEENQRRSEEELRQRDERKGEGFGSGEAW